MKISVLIVDDEPLARQRLIRLLDAHDTFECIGEAGDGRAAVEFCQQQAVDLVLLDVEMPGLNGMEAARALVELDQTPLMVFCTAYDDFALEAFGVNAVDYLLKPIRSEHLQRALDRVTAQLSASSTISGQNEENTQARSYITVRSYQGLQKIPIESIYYFQADQKYVNVVHEAGEHLIDESLRQLETEFGERFLRIHRSTLAARKRIERLETTQADGARLFLSGLEHGVPVSRRHLPHVRREIKGN